jgi:hypothetical protein
MDVLSETSLFVCLNSEKKKMFDNSFEKIFFFFFFKKKIALKIILCGIKGKSALL